MLIVDVLAYALTEASKLPAPYAGEELTRKIHAGAKALNAVVGYFNKDFKTDNGGSRCLST